MTKYYKQITKLISLRFPLQLWNDLDKGGTINKTKFIIEAVQFWIDYNYQVKQYSKGKIDDYAFLEHLKKIKGEYYE